MTFDNNIVQVEQWLGSLSTTVAKVNAAVTDGVTLTMPRTKDIFVTFDGDDEGEPEQLPGMVLILDSMDRLTSSPSAQFLGDIGGVLYLVDEAGSLGECRSKLRRWADAIIRHSMSAPAILGSYSRVSIRKVDFALGRGEDKPNTLVLRFDVSISTCIDGA